jgi:hypothetical protein
LREEYRLKLLRNGVPRRIFRPKKEVERNAEEIT